MAGTKGQQKQQAKTEMGPESSRGEQGQGPLLGPASQGNPVRAPVTLGPQKYPGTIQLPSSRPQSYLHALEVVMGQPRFLDAPEITGPGRSPDLPGHGSPANSPHPAGEEVTQAPRRPAGSPGVSPSPVLLRE